MDRHDGKDPFDATTYNSPATLNSMVALRVFCDTFFDQHIRDHVEPIHETLLTNFVTLITSSDAFFARARAVIPELQPLASPNETTHSNPNIQRVLQLTKDLRRSPSADLSELVEDLVWSRLAKLSWQQRAHQTGHIVKDSKEQKSRPSSPLIPSRPFKSQTVEISHSEDDAKRTSNKKSPYGPIGETAADAAQRLSSKISPSSATPPESSKTNISVRKKPGPIPTFVPRELLGRIQQPVWSPTSGTRERRSGETYSTDALLLKIASVLDKGPSTEEPHTAESNSVLPNMKSGKHKSTRTRNSPNEGTESYESTPSPFGPDGVSLAQPKRDTRTRYQNQHDDEDEAGDDLSSLLRSDRELNPSHRKQLISETMYETAFGNKQNWKPVPSNMAGAKKILPNPARGNIGADSFSAPPSIPGFANLHVTSHGLYRGPVSASFTPQPGQIPRSSPGSLSPRPHPGQIPGSNPRSPAFLPQVAHAPGGGARTSPSVQHIPNTGSTTPPFQRQFDQVAHHEPSHPYAQLQQPASPFLGPNLLPLSPVPSNYRQKQHPASPHFPPVSEENLTVPPPGSLSPIDYWDLLYRRETAIRTRLASAGMTPHQLTYVNRLSEARVATITSKLPHREPHMSGSDWLAILRKELTSIWEQRPGDQPPTAVIKERKADYEKAVEREIGFVRRELMVMGKEPEPEPEPEEQK